MTVTEADALPKGGDLSNRFDRCFQAAKDGVDAYFDWIDADGGEFWIWEDGDHILASGGWARGKASPAMEADQRDQAVIFGVVVSESARGQGLGRTVMNHLEGRIAASGVKWALLEVVVGNQAAEGLYATRGFKAFETVMAKRLSSPDA